jgi:hypothetical protein
MGATSIGRVSASMRAEGAHCDYDQQNGKGKDKGKVHPCTGTEALYRPYGP